MVTNYGEGRGATKQEGGGWSFTLTKGWGGGGGGEREKVFVGTTSFEVVLTQELEVLAILMEEGGRKKFPPLKRGGGGGAGSFTLSWGGGAQVLDPRFSQNVQELCRTCFCLNESCFMEYCQMIYWSFSDDSFSLFYVLWLEDQGPKDNSMIILFF